MQAKIPPETAAATDAIQKRIVDLKGRPVPTEAGPHLFHYDPDKPLSLPPKPGNPDISRNGVAVE